jgi:hypothetical protein
MLKEIQMTPRLLLRVMDPAPVSAALRAREPRALREIDPQIQPLARRIELDADYLPRVMKTKRSLKQAQIVHHRLPSSPIRSQQTSSRAGRYPPRMPRSRIVSLSDPWVRAVVATPRRSRDFLSRPPAVVE